VEVVVSVVRELLIPCCNATWRSEARIEKGDKGLGGIGAAVRRVGVVRAGFRQAVETVLFVRELLADVGLLNEVG
jgi:hypothetical protein